ncbi:hypothetical protein Pelo_14575 [Pelomyxa schiedti]|nr:hypothetical protein Pelo_14575 [Pelomyxa schiedti]
MSDRKEFEAFMASFNAQFRTTGGAAASPDTTAKPPTAIPPAMREGLQQMKAFLDDQDRGIENSKAQTTQTLEKIKEVNKDIEDLEQRLLLTKIAENKARRELEQKERDLKEKIETEKRAHEAEIRMLKKMIDEANFSTESDQHKSLRLKLEQEQLETERLNRDRDKILSELEELRAILQTEQQVKADLERQAEEKKEMYNKLKADHENKLKALKKQLCDALETQKNYMETLTESSAKKDALAASVKQKEAELHDTQLQITMVKQHNTNLHRERRHVAHKVEKERRSLEETIESYTKSMKRLSSSTKTHKTAVSKSHEIEKHHELFSKELNTLQEDIQDLDSFIVTEEHRLRSMTNYTRQLQEQNRELEDDIVDQKVLTAETTAAVVETAEHTLKTESAKHAHRTEKLQQHLQDLSRGKESAMEILEDSRNIISQNRAEVMLSRRKINAMDEQAESAQHQAQEVSAAVKDLQRQIHQDELSIASAEQLNKVSHHKIKQLNRAKARIQKETNNT